MFPTLRDSPLAWTTSVALSRIVLKLVLCDLLRIFFTNNNLFSPYFCDYDICGFIRFTAPAFGFRAGGLLPSSYRHFTSDARVFRTTPILVTRVTWTRPNRDDFGGLERGKECEPCWVPCWGLINCKLLISFCVFSDCFSRAELKKISKVFFCMCVMTIIDDYDGWWVWVMLRTASEFGEYVWVRLHIYMRVF